MKAHSKLIRVTSVLLLAVAALWLWSALLVASVDAHSTTSLSSSFSSLSASLGDDEPADEPADGSLGEACGAGELLPPWVLCLHGTVSLIDASQQVRLLDGVPITVSYAGQSITGTTFIHPGQLTPTYGIDISELSPDFLEPVTLTALVDGMQVQRQVVVFPDFRTQSQRFDLEVMAVGGLDPAPIWGSVIDFATEGAVEGAIVVAEQAGQQVRVSTTVQPSSEPLYSLSTLDLEAIGATTGSLITLTAYYEGDADQQVLIVPPAEQPIEVNFVTGWKCDDFNPLPGTTGQVGLGRTTGQVGLPNVACLWGYGLVDGLSTSGMSVQVELSGTVYEGQSKLYLGEQLPRYGIGLWGGLEAMNGQRMTVTGVYRGFATSQVVTVALDANLSQQVDLAVANTGVLANFAYANEVNALAWHDGHLWAGTPIGVVRWNPADDSYIQLTGADGLVHPNVTAIAVDDDGDDGDDGHLWFGTLDGVSRYHPESGIWQRFTTANSGLVHNHVSAITVDGNGEIWFATYGGGVSHYDPNTGTWQSFTSAEGLVNDFVLSIASEGDHIWFGTFSGVSRYHPDSDSWQSFTTADGLVNNSVQTIAVADSGEIWFGTLWGVSRYNPTTTAWQNFTTFNSELVHNSVQTIAIADNGENGEIWFGTEDGVSRYDPDSGDSGNWQSFTSDNSELTEPNVQAIVINNNDDNTKIWFGTTGGVNGYHPSTTTWQSLTIAEGLANNQILVIAVADNEEIWFGTSQGVSRYTPNSGAWQNVTTSDGLIHNQVSSIAINSKQDEIWFGTPQGVSRYTPSSATWQSFTTADGLVSNQVRAIAVDKNNHIWFGTDSGVTRYDPTTPEWESFSVADGLANNSVHTIAVDGYHHMWFGTDGGVTRYNLTTSEWETFTTDDGLVNNVVRAIAIADNGEIWFGTYFGGVSRYYSDSGNWQSFTTSNSDIVHNNVKNIAVDGNGEIWFGTEEGVSRYHPDTLSWQSLTTAEGLADNDVHSVAVDHNGENGEIWFGTSGGVSQWAVPILQSELSLQMDGPTTVLPERPFSYTLYVANHGQLPAEAQLTLTLPANATYLDASPPPAGTTPLSWDLATLSANGRSAPLLITASLPTADAGSRVSASANVASSVPESFLSNNRAQLTSEVRDPNQADVRVSLSGPPLLVPSTEAIYNLWVDNIGGLAASDTELTVDLPEGLSYQSAIPAPTSLNPLSWDLSTLPALSSVLPFKLTLKVALDVPAGSDLNVEAALTTTAPESDLENNNAVSTVSTELADAQTLILVAPDRLTTEYGASSVLSRLYDLANHAQVQGVVLDVERDLEVQAAYAAWDADPGSWQKANTVAEAIKALVDQYTISYPNLEYLVVVGGDSIIPFYRVADQTSTALWHERKYYRYLPLHHPMRTTLAGNKLLTDDFYADRQPTVPDSYFWRDGDALYLPDFAIGRLVETPDEIAAFIDTFVANDGAIELHSAVIGGDERLTRDLTEAQCEAVQSDGIAATCTNHYSPFRSAALNQESGASWSSFHSNHFSLGALDSSDILERETTYEQMLLVSIGCHAGLNVADTSQSSQVDLPQAILRRGGTYIASSAYAYAAPFSIGYSEALSMELSEQLLGSTQTLGQAFVHAKQAYYADRGWFDYTDEKVLLPMTLYGLPMLQVNTPAPVSQRASSPSSPSALAKNSAFADTESQVAEKGSGGSGVVTYTLSAPPYSRHETEDGVYYDIEGQTIAQDGYPIQPLLQVPLIDALEDQSVHGVILRSATYSEVLEFDPLIAQSWAIGEKHLLQGEPEATVDEWDRELPYTLGLFNGLSKTNASLNLVLGAYDAQREAERLYQEITLEVLYSDHVSDRIPPTIEFINGYEVDAVTHLQVKASDESGVREVLALCDDGQGNWRSTTLQHSNNNLWTGTCEAAERFYIQVVDEASNVAFSDWQTPTTSPTTFISLVPGWNLMSIPLQPEDNNITQVLAPIAGNYDLVYAYAGCDTTDPWKKYDPSAPPFANDLNQVDETMGLWIRMTTTDTLTVNGTEPPSMTIPLCSGWNLTGYPSSQQLPVADALASIDIDNVLSLVYSYDAADIVDPWKKYDPSAPPFANDLQVMPPGQGYWIKVNQDADWNIN